MISPNQMGKHLRLDEVSTFGDKLRFLIPHEWVEREDGDDLYVYHAPDADSGWFRVSLNTLKVVVGPEQRLREIVKDGAYVLDESTGNWVKFWEKPSEEDGVPIHLSTGPSQAAFCPILSGKQCSRTRFLPSAFATLKQ